MNKIDTTKFLRQMKYLPDITPLSNILLIIVICMLIISPIYSIYFGPPLSGTITMKYVHYQTPEYWVPKLVIYKSGKISFGGGNKSFNLNEFRNVFVEYMENMQIVDPNKIMIYADAEVPWGKLIDVLQFAKEKGIKVAGFMMEGGYSVLHYWETRNRYHEKGLKYPVTIH